MSNGLTSWILLKNFAKHEWKIVCVKFCENFVRIDREIGEIQSPRLMWIRIYTACFSYSVQLWYVYQYQPIAHSCCNLNCNLWQLYHAWLARVRKYKRCLFFVPYWKIQSNGVERVRYFSYIAFNWYFFRGGGGSTRILTINNRVN